VTDGNGVTTTYDAAVVATHPGQALALLAQPTSVQAEVLGAIGYSPNIAQLHTDTSLLPRSRRAWASWNFRRRDPATDPAPGHVTVTYDLTRLMRLPTATRYLVTLGGTDLVDPATVIDTMEYEHPLYTPTSVGAQRRLPGINTSRIAFAGAYHGWGFHEDGARSGLAAAEHLGGQWPQPPAPVVYDVTIRHARREPIRHAFSYDSTMWLVDLDHLPTPGWRHRFEARDHLGDPGGTLRQNVEEFLATRGIELGGGRIRMLAQPRSLGYCFNPITVFWCDHADGTQAAVVVEVHNTYGDRHAYLVRPDEHGKATVDKELYVSPFHDVSGTYALAVPPPGDRLAVSVRLGSFTASVTGRPLRHIPRRALWAPALGMLRIRLHGLRLWRRGLTVQSRPHPSQEAVQ